MSVTASTRPSIDKATKENIRMGADALRAGQLVAFPTETVYGLGGDATNGDAVASIFAAKGRPSFNPLISHVPNLESAKQFGMFNDLAQKMAEAFWPGPLTLVLPQAANSKIAHLTCAGLDTVALRVPAHPVAQALLREAGIPMAAPSANVSGRISPTRAEHVTGLKGGDLALILDGGPCEIGLESTIVMCTGRYPRLLRHGGISTGQLQTILGQDLVANTDTEAGTTPLSPGQLLSHYAPNTSMRLNVTRVRSGEALLAFGGISIPGAEQALISLNLSADGELREAAANLFGHLHELDAAEAKCIAVMPVPNSGLGVAINDRLRRAAAPRN